MTQIAGEARVELIDRVVAHVLRKMPKDDAPLVGAFVRQYYMSTSTEDLSTRSLVDLYGAVVSHWKFIHQRKKGQSKVRVYNPQFEQHGWQSTHTVIDISQEEFPFLLDSVRMELNRRGLTIHLIMYLGGMRLKRDLDGRVIEILPSDTKDTEALYEAPMFLEIDRQSDPEVLEEISAGIQSVLKDVRDAVADWQIMLERMDQVIAETKGHSANQNKKELGEVVSYLEWVRDNNFTFLGYSKQELISKGDVLTLEVVPDSILGITRSIPFHVPRNIHQLPEAAQQQALSSKIMLVGKTSTLSRVHRPVYTDFISIKIFDKDGHVVGEHRFIGLYTSAAYHRAPTEIPFLREKVSKIFERSGLFSSSHDGKTLINIIDTLPRDELFQATVEELYDIAIGILHLQERHRIKLFIRKDIFSRFFSCLVFVPRDRFNSELRQKMQEIIRIALQGKDVSFETRFSESVLARIHFIVRVNSSAEIVYDLNQIENKLIEASRTWQDQLLEALEDLNGEEKGNHLYHRYSEAFTISYRDAFIARTAAFDIQHMESLKDDKVLAMSFYRSLEEKNVRFKLFQPDRETPLSDMMPMLECMGLRVIGERPYEVKTKEGKLVWINDFSLLPENGADLDTGELKEVFQDAFYHIWQGYAESDRFNQLVLSASLNWREVAVLRAYAKYLRQIGFTFSQVYIERTLAKNASIVKLLVKLFHMRFNIGIPAEERAQKGAVFQKEIEQELEGVQNLDEDRILRRYVDVILASLRTNYYQKDEKGNPKEYISIKFDPKNIPELPLPRPLFEIFVYSPRVEGIHLRAAKVARGGIRWSDRQEDFRTEVLGLVKAQQVKNAVIVPMGAKGGFIVKRVIATRDEYLAEGIYCYQTFIRGLLDLTDNLKEGEVIPPSNVVRYDEDDPYLVVAADKGTASFSDIANKIAIERGFWLGDAFASGGSAGYDHKKMGITARGAWESVKRHFREMGIDTQTQDFKVIGIGDMSGDVFGNGMLLSKHIVLVAGFDHRHIFVDPNPDPQKSYEERLRLFNLPRSSWVDYRTDLISEGGGIFSRTAKSIRLTPGIQKLLGIKKESLEPTEFIKCLLKAEVDLIWNGGIGTYVKSSVENNVEVGDRTNDALRVSGNELRAKVIGEGGNLGMTQLGRVQYALKGGRLNTDAIDNSAGVDCSDHEVNIKILMNQLVSAGELTEKKRNKILSELTDEIAELVIADNRAQTEALSIVVSQAASNVEMHIRLMTELERSGKLDRSLEFLPANEDLLARKLNGKGLTRPEFAILMAYVKNGLKEALMNKPLLEESYLEVFLMTAFPKGIANEYRQAMSSHHLKREIIATQLANYTINEMGLNFIQRLIDETGASVSDILKCYVIVREVFSVVAIRKHIRSLDNEISSETQVLMYQEVNRLARRGTRWFLRHRHLDLGIEQSIQYFSPGVAQIAQNLRKGVRGVTNQIMEAFAKELMAQKVPESLAYSVAGMSAMFSALDIVEAANKYHFSIDQVMFAYFSVGARLKLGWFREQIKHHPVTNHWDSLARAALRDDLDRQQRTLTIGILQMDATTIDVEQRVDLWVIEHKYLVDRWYQIIADLKAAPKREFIMFSVGLRELLDLAQASVAVSV